MIRAFGLNTRMTDVALQVLVRSIEQYFCATINISACNAHKRDHLRPLTIALPFTTTLASNNGTPDVTHDAAPAMAC
jgi:hypothetical protein